MSSHLALGLVAGALVAVLPYLLAVWRAPRWPWRRARWWVLGIALGARLVVLPLPALLTTDLHRYHWEGRVQRAGFNPYRHAPDDPALSPLRDANWAAIEHREVPSSYPPLLLMVFRAVAGATGTYRPAELAFKLLGAGADLAVLALLIGLLRRRGANPTLALVWGWSPLVILGFAGNGHALGIAIMWFVAGLWVLDHSRLGPAAVGGDSASARQEPRSPGREGSHGRWEGEVPTEPIPARASSAAGLFFALAIQFHYLALVPVLAAIVAARPRSGRFWGPFALVLVAPFLAFADAGPELWQGLTHFAGRWRFNGSVYEILARLTADANPRRLAEGVWLAHGPAKLAGAVAVALALAWVAWRRAGPPRAALAVTATLLLVSSTVHPWYLAWLVAFSALELRAVWVAWSGLVLLAYAGALTGGMTGWLLGIEYVPVFILLGWHWLRRSVDRL